MRLPSWCRAPRRRPSELAPVARLLRRSRLASVCEEARCPNRGECWSRRTLTFLLLGEVCTRACRFCSVASGRPPAPPDPTEAERVARAVAALDLAHVVLTSVNRDDLPDGGSAHFAAVVRAVREARPEAGIEVLTPDFRGDEKAVETVCAAGPDVFAHNVETVPRLERRVRSGGRFERSLRLLARARRALPRGLIKSGLMVGHGERREEVIDAMARLRDAGVQVVTIGQYLRPTRAQLPVVHYWEPDEFGELAAAGRRLGLEAVVAGPLVRSSYRADQILARLVREGRAATLGGRAARSGSPRA